MKEEPKPSFIDRLRELLARNRRWVRGGYRYIRVRDVLLDKRQKKGVTLFYAELVERNKYAPGWAKRGMKR